MSETSVQPAAVQTKETIPLWIAITLTVLVSVPFTLWLGSWNMAVWVSFIVWAEYFALGAKPAARTILPAFAYSAILTGLTLALISYLDFLPSLRTPGDLAVAVALVIGVGFMVFSMRWAKVFQEGSLPFFNGISMVLAVYFTSSYPRSPPARGRGVGGGLGRGPRRVRRPAGDLQPLDHLPEARQVARPPRRAARVAPDPRGSTWLVPVRGRTRATRYGAGRDGGQTAPAAPVRRRETRGLAALDGVRAAPTCGGPRRADRARPEPAGGVLARGRAGRTVSPCPRDLCRPHGRRRRLRRAVDRAARQATQPGRARGAAQAATIGWAASGRNGGFCSASLTHGEANGRRRWPQEYDALERLGRRTSTRWSPSVRAGPGRPAGADRGALGGPGAAPGRLGA